MLDNHTTMQSVPITTNGCKFEFCSWRCLLDTTLCDKVCQAKIKNKFVSPYPTDPVKIDRLKKFHWKFAVTFFFLFFFPFRSKFVLLKIPYFRFVLAKDRYFRTTEHIFVVKKKKRSLPIYPLPKLWVG